MPILLLKLNLKSKCLIFCQVMPILPIQSRSRVLVGKIWAPVIFANHFGKKIKIIFKSLANLGICKDTIEFKLNHITEKLSEIKFSISLSDQIRERRERERE